MSAIMTVFPPHLTIPSFPSLYQYANSTLLDAITPRTINAPFYHTFRPDIFTWISDKHLSLAVPIIMYWIVSLLFHYIDHAQIPYFEKHRIHESPEVLSRNRCTVGEVVRAVIVQQAVQVVLGVLALEDEPVLSYQQTLDQMRGLAPRVADVTLLALGKKSGESVLRNYGPSMVRFAYWWAIPTLQLFTAFAVMDCWQYFWHRTFHASTFLYRHIHSVHHKLYVPYAFGALYNHPIEGFLFDTMGALVSQYMSGMNIRQATVLFGFSSAKTVDDHCGYKLWWDPLQMFFYNNADYHDIHHQLYGLKSNYSQPFFTNWDVLLGTRMTREEADTKTRSKRAKVE